MSDGGRRRASIVTPVYNETVALPIFY